MSSVQDSRILISDYSGGIHIWNPLNGNVNTIAQTGLRITDIAVAPNGEIYFITARALHKLNVETGSAIIIGSLDQKLYAGHNGVSFANGFDINNSGIALISYADNSVISRVDLQDGDILGRVNQPSASYNRSAGDIWVNTSIYVTTQSSTLVQFLPGSSGGLVAVGSRFTGFDDFFGLVGVPNGVFGLSSLGLIGFTADSAYDLGAPSVYAGRIATFDLPADITGASLVSSTFDDDIFGTSRGDVIYGDYLNQKIWGRAGSDFISAGNGRDTIVGGSAQDFLYGGAGVDIFVFDDGETGIGVKRRDVIYDFERNSDDIDLRGIDANLRLRGDQKFDFSNTTAGKNDIWYKISGGGVIVYGDTNGDSRADFEIELRGVSSLMAGDFLL